MHQKFTHLFCDLGGVFLSNGWDRYARARAIELFKLEENDMQERHKLFFHTYETGKVTGDEYLDNVIFFKPRDFSKETFMQFMCEQSTAHPEMLQLAKKLKVKYNLTMATINNEGRDLNKYRIEHFGLREIFHFFISSGHVHMSKPDKGIFELALDVAQVDPSQAIYIDDRIQFVDIARKLGMHGIHHTSYEETVRRFEEVGMRGEETVRN